jgi:hypothetical protein
VESEREKGSYLQIGQKGAALLTIASPQLKHAQIFAENQFLFIFGS